MLPNFLVIGAQKSGTTWLYYNLKEHPEIFMPEKIKELDFFTKNSNGVHNLNKYESYFDIDRKYKRYGEATSTYFWASQQPNNWLRYKSIFRRDIPKMVYDVLGPETKIIVSLRNPVHRAISAYIHHCVKGRLTDPFPKIYSREILKKKMGIIHMGFYSEHLEAWLEYFPNMLVLVYEDDIKTNPDQGLNKLTSYLEVSKHKFNRAGHIIHGKRTTEFDSLITKQDKFELLEIYEDDVAKLKKLLNRPLKSWQEFLHL